MVDDRPPVAVITGAAQGIGKRTAEILAQRGYRLLLNDLRPAAASVRADYLVDVIGDI